MPYAAFEGAVVQGPPRFRFEEYVWAVYIAIIVIVGYFHVVHRCEPVLLPVDQVVLRSLGPVQRSDGPRALLLEGRRVAIFVPRGGELVILLLSSVLREGTEEGYGGLIERFEGRVRLPDKL